MIFCKYGCGNEATIQLKNGDWVCSERNKCPILRKKNGDGNRGKKRKRWKHSDETRRKMSESRRGENNSFYGKTHKPEFIEWLKENTSAKRPEVREKMRLRKLQLFSDPEFLKKFKENNLNIKSPNKLEIKLMNIIESLFPNKYEFVGDFKIWINGKNPDFIDDKNKRIIELFGKHWHEKTDETDRINHFVKCGYKVLIIWDCELKDLELLKNKIMEFENV